MDDDKVPPPEPPKMDGDKIPPDAKFKGVIVRTTIEGREGHVLYVGGTVSGINETKKIAFRKGVILSIKPIRDTEGEWQYIKSSIHLMNAAAGIPGIPLKTALFGRFNGGLQKKQNAA